MSQWPPPNYYTTFNLTDDTQNVRFLSPIDAAVVGPGAGTPGLEPMPTRDGPRILRYQLPEAPVENGSVRIDGYLRSTNEAQGKLLDFDKNQEVGTVDHDTGLIEINVELAPGLSSRRVQFIFPRRPEPTC